MLADVTGASFWAFKPLFRPPIFHILLRPPVYICRQADLKLQIINNENYFYLLICVTFNLKFDIHFAVN